MAKRFIDTEIWEQEWLMELDPHEKLAIMYIFSRCDNIGLWKPNKTLARMFLGVDVDFEALLEKCDGSIEVLGTGHWWLVDFCEFQYGQLNENCRPHQCYIKKLQKYGLLERVCEGYAKGIEGHYNSIKGYAKGIDTLKEKEKEKETYKEEEEDNNKNKKREGIVKGGEVRQLSAGYSTNRAPIDPSLWAMEEPDLEEFWKSGWSVASRGTKKQFFRQCKISLDWAEPGVAKRLGFARDFYVHQLQTEFPSNWKSKLGQLFFWLDQADDLYQKYIEYEKSIKEKEDTRDSQ